MLSVAEPIPAISDDETSQTKITLVKKPLPVPKVDDMIYVPDSEDPTSTVAKKYNGGRATVHRITCSSTNPPQHYLYVTEHTGYKEYKWENGLAELQEELAKKYPNYEKAFIKSI